MLHFSLKSVSKTSYRRNGSQRHCIVDNETDILDARDRGPETSETGGSIQMNVIFNSGILSVKTH